MPPLSLIPSRTPRVARAAGNRSGDDELDAELLHRIAAGDRAALETLYRPYHRRLDRFLARLTRRADVIDEVINDTFWIVWQKAAQFRGDSRVSTWIVGIAYRCALKTLRQHGNEAVEPDDSAESVYSHIDPTAAHEMNDWVAKGMSRLTVEQRVTLELAYGAGHSLDEIAQIMDCQVSTVKARMFHARVRLRNLLPALAGRSSAVGAGSSAGPAEETGR